MKRVLLFGGTYESHPLISWLLKENARVTLCVAGEYAAGLISAREGLDIMVGRLDCPQMQKLMSGENFALVVDATHPYAREATENIRAAAAAAGIKYLRLLREKSDITGCERAKSVEDAVRLLNNTESGGAVLIATGSKELDKYTALFDFSLRCYPRILPDAAAIEKCERLGFLKSHIIAMQGPFSKELNIALLRQYSIKAMVTKDGGAPGGFDEKLAAAMECSARLIVVERPEDSGLSMDELKREIRSVLSGL